MFSPTKILPPGGVAVVTGGAAGIGAAFCRAFAARGLHVVVVDRDEAAARQLADEIDATIIVADLARADGAAHAAAKIQAMERVDVLVNNAGFGSFESFAETDIEHQVSLISIHVFACVRLCHAVLPGMTARGAGAIINLASMSAFLRFPRVATYCGSKLFVVGFSETLQAELEGTGVRVQALCPGNIRTGFFDAAGLPKQDQARIPDALWMSPEKLVQHSLDALARGPGR